MTLADTIQSKRLTAPVGAVWQSRRDRMKAITWAVWLGANTAGRLAREWGVDLSTAHDYLASGRKCGALRLRGWDGRALVYRVARYEPGMTDRSC